MKTLVKYVIKPNHVENTYDLFERDYRGGLTFHSRYDTLDEAQEEQDSLNTRPSKIEALKFLKDLASSMNNLN